MKLYSTLYNTLFNYVILTSKIYNIDETHSLKHSMDVFYFANKLYETELNKNHYLLNQKIIIDTSAILHDMCDKKYVNEEIGINRIKNYMNSFIEEKDLNVTLKIISTMSYSTVMKNGFPDLGEYQLAYNIVREADLLASYDYERCIMYQIYKNNDSYIDAANIAKKLFDDRVFRYNKDNLFKLDYSKKLSLELHMNALKKINLLDRALLRNYNKDE